MFSFIYRLIGRLSVSRKLVLIYALDLSAVIFVSTILINEKYIAINFARKEIVGNAYISEIREALLPIGSSVFGMAPGRKSTELLIEAERRYGEGLGSRSLAEKLAQHFDSTASDGTAANDQAHVMALAVQALVTRIGNQSNLILDPDLDSYYTMSLVVLRFPELFDLASRIGEKAIETGRATTSAARAQRQTEYLIIEGRLDAIASGIAADYEEALAAGKPALREALIPSRDTLLAAIDALRNETRQTALERAGDDSTMAIKGASRDLRNELSAAWRVAGAALDDLLDQRIDQTLFENVVASGSGCSAVAVDSDGSVLCGADDCAADPAAFRCGRDGQSLGRLFIARHVVVG